MTKPIAMPLILALTLSIAAPAAATSSISFDLIWTATSNPAAAGGLGTNALAAAPGDLVTLALLLTPPDAGVSSYGVSVRFDADGLDELDVSGPPAEFSLQPTITCTPFPRCFFDTPTMSPFTPGISSVLESEPGLTGFIYTFEAGTCGSGPLTSFGTYTIGEIQFEVTSSVATDGFDLVAGYFNFGRDAGYSNAGIPLEVSFGSASLNSIPEPATLGLVALALAGVGIWVRASTGRKDRESP